MTIINKKNKKKLSKKPCERYQNLSQVLKKASIWCFFYFLSLSWKLPQGTAFSNT